MIIDSLARFNSLVKASPFLAHWLEPMCALLTQATQIADAYCSNEQENLGHLEANLQKPLAELKSQLLERAALRKAEQAPLILPGQGQTRVRQQLVCRQAGRLVSVEDRLRDIRGEIAKADQTREVGWADAFALGQFRKRHAVAAEEGRVEALRSDQQLDQPCIRFGCCKAVGRIDQHLDLTPAAAQLDRHG